MTQLIASKGYPCNSTILRVINGVRQDLLIGSEVRMYLNLHAARTSRTKWEVYMQMRERLDNIYDDSTKKVTNFT